MTTPLRVSLPMGSPSNTHFCYQSCAPLINLMSRDLMCKLGIILTSTPEGVKVMSQPDKVFTAAQFDSSALTYAYEWKLPSSPFSQQLVEEAKALVSPISCNLLICTAHHTFFLGPAYDHEKKWFRTPFEKCLCLVYFGIHKPQHWLCRSLQHNSIFLMFVVLARTCGRVCCC